MDSRHEDGASELLGGFFRDHFSSTIPFFKTIDGSVSASCVEYDYDGQHSRVLQAIETRAGVTKQVDLGSGTRMVGLYSGFDSTLYSQPARRAVIQLIRQSTTESQKYYAINGARLSSVQSGHMTRRSGRSGLCIAAGKNGAVRLAVTAKR